jgi:transcription antitermination factor NusG
MDAVSQQWPWFAVQVKSNREKYVATIIESEGYECLLPMNKHQRRWSDRIKEVEAPLFPGYLFSRFNPNNRLPILKAPGVIQIVGIGKVPVAVEEDEIAAIQMVEKNGIEAMPWPYLRIGQVARIKEGPLKGLTGIVVKIKSGLKLVLSVSLLQRSVAVEVDRSSLSEVGPLGMAEFSAPPGLTNPIESGYQAEA